MPERHCMWFLSWVAPLSWAYAYKLKNCFYKWQVSEISHVVTISAADKKSEEQIFSKSIVHGTKYSFSGN